MSTQLHLAYGIIDARSRSTEDRALLRTVELARREQRRIDSAGVRRGARLVRRSR